MSDRNTERGFTLVEVLVTVLILGLLAAVVFPVVANRASDADPTVVSNDLANIRTGVELFRLDVRPSLPGNVEDLVNRVATNGNESDLTLEGNNYSQGQNNNWDGPYVDLDVATSLVNDTDVVRTTAFDGSILNGFDQFSGDDNEVTTTEAADFLAIQVSGLSTTEFRDVDELIDNEETGGENSGKLRFVSGEMYFLAQPIK